MPSRSVGADLDNQQHPPSSALAPQGLFPTVHLRPVPSNHQLVMDSLPQEIIDQIIDNLPHSSLCSTSLVAKRWRKRCQQHAFRRVWFGSESMVDRWHTEIQSNPGGISSYTQFAGFTWIAEWRDPTLFGRVFKNFSSLTTLGIQCITGISGKIFENISHRELCRITTLHIGDLRCSPSTVIAIILAFPNLRDLTVVDHAMEPEEPSTHSAPPQRRPLDSLFIHGRGNGPIAETLADYRFAPRRLTLDAQPQNIQKLLTFSSATIVELQLVGVYSSCGRPRKRK